MGLDTDKKGNVANRYAGMFTNKADFDTELPSQMFLNFPWLLVNIALHIGLNAVGAGGTDFVFLGSKINLQVEYFILASGGKIFYSLEEIRKDFVGKDTE